MQHTVFLGLGSNMGDREAMLRRACDEIERRIGKVVARSAFMETEPWGFESDNRFMNAVVRCSTALAPLAVLEATQRIERLLGKRQEHETERGPSPAALPVFHDRPIDIDLLFYDHLTLHTDRLTLPHPLIKQRDFVRLPLREVLVLPGDDYYLPFV